MLKNIVHRRQALRVERQEHLISENRPAGSHISSGRDQRVQNDAFQIRHSHHPFWKHVCALRLDVIQGPEYLSFHLNHFQHARMELTYQL